MRSWKLGFVTVALLVSTGYAASKLRPSVPMQKLQVTTERSPWTPQRAWKWFYAIGPIRGVNFEPSSAVNDTDIWQAETFDPKTIDRELGWAHDIGYNNVRVFLQYLVWEQDPSGFKKRINQFLQTAEKHGMRMMPVLFDDCVFAGDEPYLGKQADPIPGVHNSQWTPSPGHRQVTDHAAWPKLEAYIKDVVGSFGADKRVLIWDLYNEPGNSGMGEKSLPLMTAAFGWARSMHPSQPLTMGVWSDFNNPLSLTMLHLSDIVSFHGYDPADGTKKKVAQCRAMERPILCTEWLCREFGNTFDAILPIFAENNIGWYSTALVAGKTQAYMHWGSEKGSPVPKVWQHCVLKQDGTPYDPAEIELIKSWKPVVGTKQ